MADEDVIIRIKAQNLSKREFDAARKQLDDLGKKAGLTNAGMGQLGKGFQKAANDLASFNPTAAKASSLLGGFGPAGLAAAAGIGAVSAVVGFGIKNLIEMGDRLTKLSRTTTISTDALQRMEAFGRPLGITLEQMASSSNKLDKALGGGGAGIAKALKTLNLSLDDLSAMTADERLRTVQIALSNLKNPLDQASAGAALLGKSWAEMRLDSASIEEGNAALEGLIVVSKEALEAGDALGDSWGKLWANMKASAAEGSSEIVKALTAIVQWADSALRSISETNKQIEHNLQVTREAERLAGGPFALQGLVSGGASSRDALNAIRKQAEENIRITNLVAKIQGDADKKRLDDLKKVQAGQRGLTDDEQKDVERLQKAHEKAAEQQIKDLARISEAHAKAAGEAWMFWDEAYVKIAQENVDFISAAGRFSPGGAAPVLTAEDFARATEIGFGKGTTNLQPLALELDNFGLSLEQAAQLTQVFGDSLGAVGEAFIQGSAIGDLMSDIFEELGSDVEGLGLAFAGAAALIAAWGATETGSQGKRALSGAAAGAAAGGAIVPGWGHLIGAGVGALVGWLRGAGPAQVGEDAGRDIGAALSQSLMEEIHKSGENAQLFLREIFAEGDLGIDRLAEEVGDLFSFLERGEISQETLLGEMSELLPILIENFDELGETGKDQIDRIIDAAQQAGIDLGFMGDQLDRLRKGIPELTLEGFASKFDLSEEQQAKLQGLGLGIQTDEERVADELNIPLELLKELAPALEEIGVSLAELPDFLEASGKDLTELGTALDLPPELLAQLQALAPPDPATTGQAMADALLPGFEDALDRLGEKIIRGISNAVAHGT